VLSCKSRETPEEEVEDDTEEDLYMSSLALKQRDSFIMSQERVSQSRVSIRSICAVRCFRLTYLLTRLARAFIAATLVNSVSRESSPKTPKKT